MKKPKDLSSALWTVLMLLAVVIVGGPCLSAWAVETEKPLSAADAFEQNKRLGRGVNIIGYDPVWKDRGRSRFQAEHF